MELTVTKYLDYICFVIISVRLLTRDIIHVCHFTAANYGIGGGAGVFTAHEFYTSFSHGDETY
jgi:hypothetical protein